MDGASLTNIYIIFLGGWGDGVILLAFGMVSTRTLEGRKLVAWNKYNYITWLNPSLSTANM
jgi:hypothetical protein